MEPEQTVIGKEVFNLNRVGTNESGSHCGYCQSDAGSYTWGFIKDKMYPLTYELMIEKGWRRCGTYYYKPDLQKSCCKSWTHRLNVNNFKIKKDQKKTIKKFLNYANPTHTNPKKQTSQVKHPNKQTNQPKQMEKELSQNEIEIMIGITKRIDQIIRERYQEFMSLFVNDLEHQGNQELFKLDIENKLKCFSSKGGDKHDAFCNYFMIVFGINKKLFKKEYKNTDFMKSIGPWVEQTYLKQIKNSEISIKVERSGYLLFNLYPKQTNKVQQMHPQKKQQQQIPDKKKQKNQKKQPEKKQQNQNSSHPKLIITSEKIICGDLIIKLEKATVTNEAWAMYQDYCQKIHQKPEKSKNSYRDFLCLQALEFQDKKTGQVCEAKYTPTWEDGKEQQKIQGTRTKYMGCYHMNYYLKGKLIGVGVIDILPNGLSSVYFFYDPQYKDLRLGVVSSLIQIEYTRWLQLSFPEFKYYYMGFYLQNCQKMSYKGDYEPCQVLCPITFNFVNLDQQIRSFIDRVEKKQTNQIRLATPNTPLNQDMNFPGGLVPYINSHFKLQYRGQILGIGHLNPGYVGVIIQILREFMVIWGKTVFDLFTFTL